MYVYDDLIVVTGSHLVHEDGKWLRVKDAKKAELTDHVEETVYSFSCENHMFFSHDILFRDFDELDHSQGLTDDQLVKIINGE